MVLIDSPEMLNKPLELKAPFEGDVVRNARETVARSWTREKNFIPISDLKNIWVIADVNPNEIGAVSVWSIGHHHRIALPAETSAAPLRWSARRSMRSPATVKVRVAAENSGAQTQAGNVCRRRNCHQRPRQRADRSDEALQKMEDNAMYLSPVITARSPTGRSKPAPRNRGHRNLDGLKDGDGCYQGKFLLKSELLKSQWVSNARHD